MDVIPVSDQASKVQRCRRAADLVELLLKTANLFCISHRVTRWASSSKATSDENLCSALRVALEGTCGT